MPMRHNYQYSHKWAREEWKQWGHREVSSGSVNTTVNPIRAYSQRGGLWKARLLKLDEAKEECELQWVDYDGEPEMVPLQWIQDWGDLHNVCCPTKKKEDSYKNQGYHQYGKIEESSDKMSVRYMTPWNQHMLSTDILRSTSEETEDEMKGHCNITGGPPQWTQEALEKFKRHGCVVLKRAVSPAMCHELLLACKEAEKECRARHPDGNRDIGRWSYSIVREHLPTPQWFNLLQCPSIAEMIPVLFPQGGVLVAGGGDFCAPHMSAYQKLHSDIAIKREYDIPFPCPYLCMNVAVQPCGYENGSIRVLPGTHVTSRHYVCPQVDEELLASKLSRVLMDTGDVLFRDVRTIHGGTPNKAIGGPGGCGTRYLPSLEFSSNEFRASKRGDIWPIKRVVPRAWAQKLKPSIRPFLEDVIMKN